MKKLLLLLLTLFIMPIYGFCASWQMMPVSVYIPNHPKANLMKSAFLELADNSNGYLAFNFVNEQRKKKAYITVEFVDYCNHDNAVGLTYQNANTYAFLKNSIKIGLRNPSTGKYYSDKDLYTIMIHEAGHSVGMVHTKNPKDIMFPYLNPQQKSLTNTDISQIKYLYR